MSITDDAVLGGLRYDHGNAREAEADALAATSRLAATTVRRHALRHDWRCRGWCRHRNHRRDQQNLDMLLDILDLKDELAEPGDYGHQLAWAAVTRSEYASMLSGKAA